jgi:uncharacterized protein (DUF2384 family)
MSKSEDPMLSAIIGSLSDTYRPEGVGIWLNSPNRRLDDRRPLDLIRDGQAERVLAEADRLAGGPRTHGNLEAHGDEGES